MKQNVCLKQPNQASMAEEQRVKNGELHEKITDRQQPGALGHPRERTADFMLQDNKLSQESDRIGLTCLKKNLLTA